MVKKSRSESKEIRELRKRAEALLRPVEEEIPDMSPEDIRRVVHDLHTHQIELEMQNEELRRAQEELTESHDRYTDLYDFAPVGYLTLSEKGLILEANLTLAGMLEVDRGLLIKQPFSAFIVPEDEDVYYFHRKRIRETRQRQTCELRLRKAEGDSIFVQMDYTYVDAAAGNGFWIRGSITDITARVRAEEEQHKLEAQLRRVQQLESLGVMAGGIAHDFNNILMGILGNVELALEDLSRVAPARDSVVNIRTAAKRAAELVRQMLTYAGEGESDAPPMDVTEVVKEMAHLVEAGIPKNVDLRYNLAESLPAVEVDVDQFRQIVMNLVVNASEAIGDENGVVSIRTGVQECSRELLAKSYVDDGLPAGRYVFVEVVDSGCGMDRERQEKIFDPFFSTKFPGRGLGLGATLGIVRSHSGAIHVKSEPGRGSTFKVLFPATDGLETSAVTPPEEAVRWSGEGTVLVVEDEAQVREVSRRILERMGFDVKTAVDGMEALEVFREHADEIDCVLLDVAMPRMGGEETLPELKRIKPDVRVVLVSGFGQEEIQRRFAGKGLAGFMEKPYDPAEFRKVMREVMSR